jgi:hypothetical protein
MVTRAQVLVGTVAFVAVVVIATLLSAPATPVSSQGSNVELGGYAWSENIGWIDMSGVEEEPTGGWVGYSWSEHIGWIKFGGLSSFPSGGGTVAQDASLSGSTLTGWARACAGTVSADCSSMTSRTDGWDGWVALSGTEYGPSVSGNNFSGYAYGGEVVGWIDFSGVSYATCSPSYQCLSSTESEHTAADCSVTVTTCVSPDTCNALSGQCESPAPPPPSGCLSVNDASCPGTKDALVRSGGLVDLYWSVANVTSCTISGGPGAQSGLLDTGTLTVGPIDNATTYTISCPAEDGVSLPFTESVLININPEYQEV